MTAKGKSRIPTTRYLRVPAGQETMSMIVQLLRRCVALLGILPGLAFAAETAAPAFGPPVPLRTASGPVRSGLGHVLVVDWDQDGRQDLLISGTTGVVTFARNLARAGIETPVCRAGDPLPAPGL